MEGSKPLRTPRNEVILLSVIGLLTILWLVETLTFAWLFCSDRVGFVMDQETVREVLPEKRLNRSEIFTRPAAIADDLYNDELEIQAAADLTAYPEVVISRSCARKIGAQMKKRPDANKGTARTKFTQNCHHVCMPVCYEPAR